MIELPRTMGMKGITIKLSETTLRQLRHQARETGRSVAALVRERVEAPSDRTNGSRPHLRPGGQPCGRPPACDEHAAQVPAIMITICDTGPLVAYINRHDPHHTWAVAVMKQVRPPMLTRLMVRINWRTSLA